MTNFDKVNSDFVSYFWVSIFYKEDNLGDYKDFSDKKSAAEYAKAFGSSDEVVTSVDAVMIEGDDIPLMFKDLGEEDFYYFQYDLDGQI